MEHEILIESELERDELWAGLLRETISAALAAEGVAVPCEVDVLLTDDEGIHQINLEQRGVDAPTDVLSFPMFEFTPGQPPAEGAEIDPETGLLPLGIWWSPWSGPELRGRNTATAPSGSWLIWPSTRCSTCWATTTWTTARRKPGCGRGRKPS